jgi:ADP-heptose:LPS heptosyltransferase
LQNKIRIKQLIAILPGLINCIVLCYWLRLFKGRSSSKIEGGLKRVLIVKLDAIGDFILWLDVAKELRRVFRPNEYEITLLGNRQWTDLAKTCTYFDEVLTIERSSFFTVSSNNIELFEKMCSTTFDIVLHPVYSREFLFGDLFVLACNAKQKIGMHGDGSNLSWWQKLLGNRCYTDLIPTSRENVGELEHNAVLLRWLGLTDFEAGVPELNGPFQLPQVHLPKHYYVVIPGASISLRMWPTSRFIELIEKVHALSGVTAVVCGGRTEEYLGKAIETGTSVPIVNLTGQTSLPELVAVISKAHFVVANETGAVHIAAALGVHSICVEGGGHFGRFIPYSSGAIRSRQLPVPVFHQMDCFGCNWKCVHKISLVEAAPCIGMVSLESVFSVVRAFVEKQVIN